MTISPNPYRDDNSQIIITQSPDGQSEYWHDAESKRLVQFGPAPTLSSTRPTISKDSPDRLPIAMLRRIAFAVVDTHLPPDVSRSRLYPLEDNRRMQTYFFRWDDFATPVAENELPPFVQVALSPDGKLVTFTNTLR